MKTKTYGLTAALVVCSLIAFGQDYTFKVLVNKGKNEVKSGANWEPVKVGASLKSLDELKVTDNAYVGLIHKSGKPMELKNAGKYKVSELDAKVGNGASVLNKYTEFILSSNTQKKNNLTATGAVHRGVDDIEIYLPPSSSYVYGDSVILEWSKDQKSVPPYVVTFTDVFETELYKIETSENNITVNLNDQIFGKENDIMVVVSSKKDNKKSLPRTLRKYSKADREKVKLSFGEYAKETSANTALNKVIQAGFFEQNKLLVDAGTAYQKAIKLEPGVPMYQEMYEQFLLRNALKVPKAK